MEEVSVLKIRIKFRKYGVMKFIGHLDMMRYFQKAIRRSNIDICYSEGYSPHQIMSFAAPLGVGITSDGEYLDIEVHSSKPSEEAIADLNTVMVDGVEITGYVKLPEHTKSAMASVAAADYEIWLKEEYEVPAEFFKDQEELSCKLHAFYEEPKEVLVTKKTKKGEKLINLKQFIFDFQILPGSECFFGRPAFYLDVSTGSTDNLKPELVMEAFFQFLGVAYHSYAYQINRKDVYAIQPDGRRCTLLEEGCQYYG